MDVARAAVGIGAGLFLYVAFKRWQESLQPGTFHPGAPGILPAQPVPQQPPIFWPESSPQQPVQGEQSAPPDSFPATAPAPDWLPAPITDAVQGIVNTIFPMRTSAAGRTFIQQKEGFSLTPYGDAGGQSIYWGHFIQPGETFLHTMADALAWFERDIAKVEAAIAKYVSVPLTQGQYDALADFIYNEGADAFAGSTLRQKLNARDYAGAAGEFSRWVYSQHQRLQVLADRRADEIAQEWNRQG